VAGRDLDGGDAFGAEDGVEGGAEFGVPVADEEVEVEGADLITEVHQKVAGGLGGPGRVRVRGHPEYVHPVGTDLHHEQDVEAAQCDGVEGEEVSGQQPGGLRAQEGSPPGVATPWCRAKLGGGQDPPDSACAYAVPESDEFSLDAAVTPGGVLLWQACTRARISSVIGGRSDRLGLGPVSGDQPAVPGQQRGRCDDPMGLQRAGSSRARADRMVRPGEARSGHLAAEYCDFLARDEDLDVLGCGAAGE
jgi:hypothetical protein